jgi:CO dehydrogenase/acetyl-CoA synthase beta subunit
LTDYHVQIQRVHQLVASWGRAVKTHNLGDRQGFAEQIGLAPRGQGQPSVVVGDAVGAELGKPGSESHAMVLVTTQSELVVDGRVRCLGPDLDRAGPATNLPFSQVVMLACNGEPPPSPFDLETTQYLPNRLPGFMARTVPGRLWVRFSREAIHNGFRLHTLGFALIAAFRMDFPQVTGAEVLLATGDEKSTRGLEQVAAEFKVLSGNHRKLVLVEDGVYDCSDLNCESCDQKEICDALRNITVRYRKEKKK